MRGWLMRRGLLWLLVAGWANGQSTVHLPTQGRSADFSRYPETKPARVVTSLPGACTSGEVVAVASGPAAGLYVCNGNGWVAAAPHGHQLSEMAGVSGKNGTGTMLQAFGGGAVQAGDCAQFDAEGNLVSAHAPCGGAENFSLEFNSVTLLNLNHNLGTRSVLVGCTDQAGAAVIPDGVLVLNENSVRVTFAVAQSGRCVVNASGGGGGGGASAVSSVFGRTGAVTAQAGDYNFSQIAGQLALSQISASALQGNGSKIQLFSGTAAANDCAKFDANGNLVSAGAPCGTGTGAVSSVFGRTGAVTAQAGDYSFSQIAGQLALNQISASALQGNGSKIQLFSGTAAANDCARFDANGNLVSAGAACGTGNVTGPAAAVDGEVALFQGSSGKSLRRATGSGVARLANGVLQVVSGTAADCVRADGTSGPCGGTIHFGAGLDGDGTPANPVRIAGGGAVASQAFYSASLSFGTIAGSSCAELNIPAPGATGGETVSAGMPEALPAGISGLMYSGTNVVVVRLCNATTAGIAIPDGLTYAVRIVRGF